MKKLILLAMVAMLAGCGSGSGSESQPDASPDMYHYTVTVPRPGDTSDIDSQVLLLQGVGCEVTGTEYTSSQIQTTCAEPAIASYIKYGSWYSIIDSDNGGTRAQYIVLPVAGSL